ncbi:decaprenyl-phosphate phosphoribosyltransferase [Romboutsia lituseburensis]|uniref:4-hydroxybenzoate polyprenyltransferase n=1 Tax=Romboutsia lituseburensis DSM 797 TaxID=1121325 RepID=A0A1G9QNI6_9FIRM|nr:decaprenyl-phosphate phosphoribosyltransferase [Romboutsia lituseburensis]CEH35607.1 Decaprenyl-phosphate phosphoribosyltransferase [Romboutsia lituseburensis]SDM12569.1 4-hydroxybenzoate polyprenyltransferase [Romboutsia lituseburensis DSM 797]
MIDTIITIQKPSLKDYIKLMRPKQYIKNLFVVAALIFSNKILDLNSVFNTVIAFISFCLISSAVYVLNDIVDIEKDKLHPKKCKRPLASGVINKSNAIILLTILVVASISISLTVKTSLAFILIIYLFNNLLYSFKIKNIVLLDVFSIAFGFILRVCAGSIAIGVTLSNWIILCTFFLSLYLGLGKRKKEISTLKDNAGEHRKILKEYNDEIINQMMTVVLSSTIVCYALYSTSNKSNPNMIFTTIFVVYGILRYNYVITTSDEGNPTDVVLKDTSLQISVLVWALSCLLIIIF